MGKSLRSFLFWLAAFPVVATAALNDSGQAQCYTSDGRMAGCEADASVLPGQDGHLGRDAARRRGELVRRGGGESGFDFVPLDAKGAPIALDSSGRPSAKHRCVEDAVTGLVWYVADPLTAAQPASTAESVLQIARQEAWCGFTDWRLPSVPELLGIANFGDSADGIDTTFFPDVEQGWYRSADRIPGSPELVRVFGYRGGSRDGSLRSFAVPAVRDLGLRLVRGSASTTSLHASERGTVIDTVNALEWDRCIYGRHGRACKSGRSIHQDWPAALEAIARANARRYKGHDDWRMPNVKELYSIVDQARTRPAINTQLFPETESDWYWTSTTRMTWAGGVHTIDFDVGQARYDSKPESHYLRMVRDLPAVHVRP